MSELLKSSAKTVKLCASDSFFANLKQSWSKNRSKSTQERKKVLNQDVFCKNKKVSAVRNAISALFVSFAQLPRSLAQAWRRLGAGLTQAWRRLAQLRGEGVGLPRDTFQVSHSLTKIRVSAPRPSCLTRRELRAARRIQGASHTPPR